MERTKNDTISFRSIVAQFLAAMGFSITNGNIGIITAMPTIVIGALLRDDSPLGLSESQASWFGSLLFIAQPTGSLVSGFLQNRLGRKTCLMLINVPQLAAWMILYYAPSVAYLFVAVVMMGLSVGFLEAPLLSYIGEVTQPQLRGVFSCFAGIFLNMGFMIESFLGAALPWRSMVLYSALSPVVGFTMMALLPDSPTWLVTKGRVREAERAYQWLRGWVPPEVIKEELETIVGYVRETQGQSPKYFQKTEYNLVTDGQEVVRQRPSSTWRVMTEPEVLTAFRIILSYFAIAACASLSAMRPFFIEILENLNSSIRPHNVVAICGVLQMLGSVAMGLAMKPLGKRGLTFLSLGLCIACCFGIGGYIVLGAHVPWVPVLLFCVSYFSGTLGIVAMPWILTSELFPLRAKSMGSSICGACAYFCTFVVTKTYYDAVSWLGVWGTCFLYGAIGILGLVYLYLDLPETEGQALVDIERRLSERRSSRRKIDKKHDTNQKESVT